jgi:hypothetical protein
MSNNGNNGNTYTDKRRIKRDSEGLKWSRCTPSTPTAVDINCCVAAIRYDSSAYIRSLNAWTPTTMKEGIGIWLWITNKISTKNTYFYSNNK